MLDQYEASRRVLRLASRTVRTYEAAEKTTRRRHERKDGSKKAERAGFEPADRLLAHRRFSKAVLENRKVFNGNDLQNNISEGCHLDVGGVQSHHVPDPQLNVFVQAWKDLSPELRAALIAAVGAATSTGTRKDQSE